MIALVLAMARSRLGQLVTMLALVAAAVATATSVPLFLSAADRSLVRTELAAATPAEQLVSVTTTNTPVAGAERDNQFQLIIPAALHRPGFETTFAAEYTALFTVDPNAPVGTASPAQAGTARTGATTERLVFREHFCANVTMLAGRCPVGAGEVVLGSRTAAALGLGPGATLGEQEVVHVPDGDLAIGTPVILAVVGVYQPVAPGGAFWAGQSYFLGAASPGQIAEPVFTGPTTLAALPHGVEHQSVDARLLPEAVRPARFADLRAELQKMRDATTTPIGGAQLGYSTHIGDLLSRVERDRVTLRAAVPVAAVPLVALSWLGFYLAVSATTAARRDELGLIKLRGTGALRRWSLALGESLLAIVLGAPIGYLLGLVLVRLLAAVALPGRVTGAPGGGTLAPVGLAVAGAVVAAVLAQRRTVALPVVDLLRRVAGRTAGWRGFAVEAVVVALTAAAVYQARSSTGPLTGVAQAAPGLVILSVALVGGRLLAPLVRRGGRSALRRGRLGLGLSGLRLARRPGLPALLAVLVVALGQLGFALVAGTVADAALSQQVRAQLGADRVLDVQPAPPTRLLAAVRAADPTGRYAMATATVPRPGNAPPVLAVDATRLRTVATWLPAFGPVDVDAAATALRPATAATITVPAGPLSVDATVTSFEARPKPHLFALLQSLGSGGTTSPLDLGALTTGRHTYTASAARCGSGCRLAGLRLASQDPAGDGYLAAGVGVFALVIHTVQAGGPATALTGWQAPLESAADKPPTLTETPAGLAVSMQVSGLGSDPRLLPGDFAYPAPAITSIQLPAEVFLTGLSGTPLPVHQAGLDLALPGLGSGAVLIDLETAERTVAAAGGSSIVEHAQVWLAPDAPADLVAKLTAAGLTVTGEKRAADVLRYQHRQGPGLALRYHYFAAGLALVIAIGVLALTAAVDRRSDELTALRPQGVPAGVLHTAARAAAILPVLVAVVLAGLATALAWALLGALLPVSVDPAPALTPVLAPPVTAQLLAFPLAGLVLIAIAGLTAYGRDRSRTTVRGRIR